MSDKGDSALAISSFTCIGENGRKEGVGGGGWGDVHVCTLLH